MHFLKWLMYLHIMVVSHIQSFRVLADEIISVETPKKIEDDGAKPSNV